MSQGWFRRVRLSASHENSEDSFSHPSLPARHENVFCLWLCYDNCSTGKWTKLIY